MTVEIASAVASGTVGEVVGAGGDILEAGGDILEASDDVVEELTENLPAGSVVNQMWDVVLIRVALASRLRQRFSGGANPAN